jgi:alpha-glucoside transport system substrate-binding protein
MPPELRGAFHRAVLEFFRDPTQRQLDSLLQQLETVRVQVNRDSGTDPTFRPPQDICE